MMAGVEAEAEAGALMTEAVPRTARLRRHPMETIRRWGEWLKRRDTLRRLPVVRRWWTPAAKAVAERQPRETGRRMTRQARHGSPRAGRGTLGITTFPMQSDGQWEPGRARRSGR